MLGHDHLGLVDLVGIGVRPFLVAAVHHRLAVDQHDHVRVLLDGFPTRAGRWSAGRRCSDSLARIELREAQHRHAQLAGQGLHPARDGGDFLLAIVGLARTFHQLQVVQGENLDAVLEFEAAGLSAQVYQPQPQHVVDEDLARRQVAHGIAEAVLVLLGEHAAGRNFWESAPLRGAGVQCTSCCLDISSEKTAQGFLRSIPTCSMMFMAKEVLPTLGGRQS